MACPHCPPLFPGSLGCFRNREHFKTAFHFHCGGLDLYRYPLNTLMYRMCRTHSVTPMLRSYRDGTQLWEMDRG